MEILIRCAEHNPLHRGGFGHPHKYRIDHHRKNEPGVPKGWKDYHPGEGSHCPWGHPHKYQFIALLPYADMHIVFCRVSFYQHTPGMVNGWGYTDL